MKKKTKYQIENLSSLHLQYFLFGLIKSLTYRLLYLEILDPLLCIHMYYYFTGLTAKYKGSIRMGKYALEIISTMQIPERVLE